MVSQPSPTGRRQIVRKVNAPSSLGSHQPSFNLSMMQLPVPDDMISAKSNSAFGKSVAGSSKAANSTTFNNKIKANQRRDKDLKNLGSFARAALPNMSRDNSEKRGALPNFMSRGNSRQPGVATPKQAKGDMIDVEFF